MNRKAVTMAFVVMTTLFLLLTIGLLLFYKAAAAKTETFAQEEKCRASVETAIVVDMGTQITGQSNTVNDFASNLEKCNTIPISLEDRNQGQLETPTVLYMEKCWMTFKKGQKLFSKGDGTFCHRCYVVTYPKNAAFDPDVIMKTRPDSPLQNHYDVPKQVSGVQNIYFMQRKVSSDINSKIIVRPVNEIPADCLNAVFPSQLVT
jgi:hypothetical protein